MEVFYTSPWVPPEWIKAHGLEPRGIWLAKELVCEPLSLAAGVCAFANAAVSLAEQQADSAVVFTSHCDQLRRGFDSVAEAVSSRVFLFNLPVTWQTPVAERIYLDELRRLGQFLLGLGGHAPTTGELAEIMARYSQARSRLLAAAAWCPARSYAEAVARFHHKGSADLPTECCAPVTGAVPLALVGGPLPHSQMPLLDAIDKAGGRVVLNATEAGERSLWPASPQDQAQHTVAERSVYAAETSDKEPSQDSPAPVPLREPRSATAALPEQLARTYLANYVDVFQRPNTRLYDWLGPRLTSRGVRGIVLLHYVACDLWRAEAQPLREAFGLPVLLLDADQTASHRNTGRLQAFLESLR